MRHYIFIIKHHNSKQFVRIILRVNFLISGPLSVAIRDGNVVSLESNAFSWLLMMEISNVNQLNLSPEVFMLDPGAANVGNHGPGMSVSICINVCKFSWRLL